MRSVMITGASRGIGLEFVRAHAADGYQVYATCHNISNAVQLKALQAKGPGKIEIIEMDVTNAEQVKAVAERLKGKPIDLLINNAGSVERIFYGSGAYEGKDDPDLRNYDFEGWLDLLKTNLLGPARVCGAFVDNLAAGERPVAVNMASTLSSIGPHVAGRPLRLPYQQGGAQHAHPQRRRMVPETRHHTGVDFAGLDLYRNGRTEGHKLGRRTRSRECAT